MSSRRKSSTPCMVRVVHDRPEEQDRPEEVMDVDQPPESAEESRGVQKDQTLESPDQQSGPEPPEENQNPEPLEQEERASKVDHSAVVEDDVESTEEKEAESEPASQKKQSRGYECKYCPFSTQNLNDFKEHVDSSHPNVILNPLYVCAACNFNTKKFDSLTEHNDRQHPGETDFKFKRIKMNNQTVLEQTIQGKDKPAESSSPVFVSAAAAAAKTPQDGMIQQDQITALNINGTVIIPEPAILQGLSHVTPVLQLPPNFNSVPKIAVPLNTTKYNPSLDDNLTLITSFSKFPYPTHAELSWLTAASKHPEEQIKVWFTTQRLKQGITWSPEEVEEARKKMFNGSIPPTHPMFTSPLSTPSAKVSQQPVVHTTVQHPGHVRTTSSTAVSLAELAVGSTHNLKRPLPAHIMAAFGPESKRPVMAVAPHSGEPKDKILMAPPPPPPPQKDRFLKAVLPVAVEMKRPLAAPMRSSATVPLMLPPPTPSPQSLSSKGKTLLTLGSPKTKPVASLPSIVFPESLTRPMIVPPPIFAPPFQNTILVPRPSPKEKPPNVLSLPASDSKLPNSPPLISPQIRRPPIIQSIRAPAQSLGFPVDGKKAKEQHGVDLKACFPRGDKVLTPLAEANGKWSHNPISAPHNNGVLRLDGGGGLKPDFQQKSSVLTQFPLLERMKGKTAEQLKVLEENFLRNSFPTHSEVDGLCAAARLSHQEVNSWFVERRALRDNLEQALLNSMGTKRTEKPLQQQQQHQTVKLNGIHKPSIAVGHLKSPVAPPVPPSCSVPADGPSLLLLKDDFAQTRWPSPEELIQLEGRIGLARADLARWFTDTRLQSGSMELTELFNSNGINGGQGAPVGSPEDTPSSIIQRCQEGAITNNVLEAQSGWLMEQRVNNNQTYDDVHDRFVGRLRQQSVAELKNGGQNGGVVGGARAGGRDLFGTWLEDGGHSRRPELLLLDRERTMVDEASGRLTG